MSEAHDSGPSTLWSVSAFNRARLAGEMGTRPGDRATLLPTTLLADLRALRADPLRGDVLEVFAACTRNREAALLYLLHGNHVWPVTVFPRQDLYHSPRAVEDMDGNALSNLRLVAADPPGVRPPGDVQQERIGHPERYRPLSSLAWSLALRGPRTTLLQEISGRVAYRLSPAGAGQLPRSLGALSSAVTRLQQEPAALRDIARWPGLSVERASRLVNALYLSGALMVSHTHPAARGEPGDWRRWFGRR